MVAILRMRRLGLKESNGGKLPNVQYFNDRANMIYLQLELSCCLFPPCLQTVPCSTSASTVLNLNEIVMGRKRTLVRDPH